MTSAWIDVFVVAQGILVVVQIQIIVNLCVRNSGVLGLKDFSYQIIIDQNQIN